MLRQPSSNRVKPISSAWPSFVLHLIQRLQPKFQLLVVKCAEHEEAYPNNWELPGKHVEPGETVRQCVERETLEETGLLVDKMLGEFPQLH